MAAGASHSWFTAPETVPCTTSGKWSYLQLHHLTIHQGCPGSHDLSKERDLDQPQPLGLLSLLPPSIPLFPSVLPSFLSSPSLFASSLPSWDPFLVLHSLALTHPPGTTCSAVGLVQGSMDRIRNPPVLSEYKRARWTCDSYHITWAERGCRHVHRARIGTEGRRAGSPWGQRDSRKASQRRCPCFWS